MFLYKKISSIIFPSWCTKISVSLGILCIYGKLFQMFSLEGFRIYCESISFSGKVSNFFGNLLIKEMAIVVLCSGLKPDQTSSPTNSINKIRLH